MTDSAARAFARAAASKAEKVAAMKGRLAKSAAKKERIAREAMEWNGVDESPVKSGEFKTKGYTATGVAS